MPDSITVTVTFRSILARFRPDPKDREPFALDLQPGATVSDMLAQRSVPPKLAHLVFVNRVRVPHDTVLDEGAQVDVYPPIAGG